MEAVWACTVIPLYLSTLSLSRYWLDECLGMVLVSSSRRSARVDLPWSIWAMMQKLRMRYFGKYYENLWARFLNMPDFSIINMVTIIFIFVLFYIYYHYLYFTNIFLLICVYLLSRVYKSKFITVWVSVLLSSSPLALTSSLILFFLFSLPSLPSFSLSVVSLLWMSFPSSLFILLLSLLMSSLFLLLLILLFILLTPWLLSFLPSSLLSLLLLTLSFTFSTSSLFLRLLLSLSLYFYLWICLSLSLLLSLFVACLATFFVTTTASTSCFSILLDLNFNFRSRNFGWLFLIICFFIFSIFFIDI